MSSSGWVYTGDGISPTPVAVPVPDETPTVVFVTVNWLELTVAIVTFVKFKDAPDATPSPVIVTNCPAVKVLAAVYVIVVPLPVAAVTEAVCAAGAVVIS